MYKAIEYAHIHEAGGFPIAAKIGKDRLSARDIMEIGQAGVYDSHKRHAVRVREVVLVLRRALLANGKGCGEDSEELGAAEFIEAVKPDRCWRCSLRFHLGADAC